MNRETVKHDALDAMWNFLQMGNMKANIPALKEHCKTLRQMLTQKTAGQEAYRKSTDVDFGDLDAVANVIVIEAMALWLSGDLDRLEARKDG